MRKFDLKQDLINQLIKLNKKNAFLPSDIVNVDWTNLKLKSQQNITKLRTLRTSAKIYEITAYVLLTITGVTSFVKVLGISTWPDLNKEALLILLTVTNTLVAFFKKRQIERLDKKFFLLDIIAKLDAEKQALTI